MGDQSKTQRSVLSHQLGPQQTCCARREPPTLVDVMAPPLSMLAALVAECLACRKPEIVNAGLQMLSKMDELLQHPAVLQEALGVGQVTPRPQEQRAVLQMFGHVLSVLVEQAC